jgi:hypothetical protein
MMLGQQNIKKILMLMVKYLNWFREVGYDRGDWIHLAQNGDQSQAFVNMVMKISVP